MLTAATPTSKAGIVRHENHLITLKKEKSVWSSFVDLATGTKIYGFKGKV